MNSIETTSAPADGGRQIGQVLAGRYRLAVFKGGDDVADVWHALDDSTQQVVTLEILRDRNNEAGRQRFLAEARRMAAIERPSVMRVASIHDGATDTFIVFEHLIPLPVVLTGLTSIARDVKPATKAADDKVADAKMAAAVTPEPASGAPSTLAAVAGPTRSAATPDEAAVDATSNAEPVYMANATYAADVTTPKIVVREEPAVRPAPSTTTVPPPDPLQAVSGAPTSARSDVSGVVAHGTQLAADARGLLRDMRPEALVAAVRELLPQGIDTSPVRSLIARASMRVRQLASVMSSARASLPRPSLSPRASASARAADPVSGDAPQSGGALATVMSLAKRAASIAAPLIARAASSAGPLIGRAASSAGPLIGRVSRVNPVILAVPIGLLLLAAFVASPLDDAIVDVLRSASASSTTAAPGSTTLRPAPFEVPPLSAYGAAFESQAAYPTTAPNGTVEWVVALRNTGSAGWYRGIDGAQAALALPDGAGVAVQSTDYVAPGQVGWFVVKFHARAELGTYTVRLLPRIDGRGPLQDLGIFAVVTVAKNP